MKLTSRLGMAAAAVAGTTLLAGCPDLFNQVPSTNPTTNTVTSTEGKLQGKLTFALATDGSSPGAQLTVGLKQQNSNGTFSKIATTTSTDNSGAFTFSSLTPATYQLVYDDEGKVVSGSFNTTGVAVSETVAVVASQSSIPQQNMELAWDFTGTSVNPKPNGSVTRTGQAFTWAPKAGVTSPVYQFTIFGSENTSSGAMLSSATTSATTLTLDLTSAVTAGTRYIVYKYYKSGGSFGGANYYGQTKPIPIIVP